MRASAISSRADFMVIRIADLLIEWQEEYSDYVSGFVSDSDEKPVMTVRFDKNMPVCHGIQYSDAKPEHLLRLENGEFLCADSDWSDAVSYYPTGASEFALPLAAICSKFSYYNALLMHASCVSIGGEGVIFTGFSGVGKTTQAELWQKYLGAEVINGDKIFIRETDDGFYGCGLPWKGSSPYCLNKKTLLRGIVVLCQAEENRITRLGLQTFEKLLPHLFMPHWDEKCLVKALDTFGRLTDTVPVYLLECRPDEDAVKLTYNTVFN